MVTPCPSWIEIYPVEGATNQWHTCGWFLKLLHSLLLLCDAVFLKLWFFFANTNRPGVFDMQFAAGNAIPQSVDSCLIIGFMPTKEQHYLVTKSDSEFDFYVYLIYMVYSLEHIWRDLMPKEKNAEPPRGTWWGQGDHGEIPEYPCLRVSSQFKRWVGDDSTICRVQYSFLDQRSRTKLRTSQTKRQGWVVMFC